MRLISSISTGTAVSWSFDARLQEGEGSVGGRRGEGEEESSGGVGGTIFYTSGTSGQVSYRKLSNI